MSASPTSPSPAHNTPRTAIDLFAGAGGFSLGLRRAGFQVVLANEYSVDPEWTYRHNLLEDPSAPLLPRCPVGATGYALREYRLEVRAALTKLRIAAPQEGDVMRGGNITTVLGTAWLGRWLKRRHHPDIDLLVAGPPCQGFSSAGKQDGQDDRNALVFEAIRVAKAVRPRVIVIENVPGMLTRYSSLLQEVGKRLNRLGYRVTVELLHGPRFGVPQTRKRIVLVGVRSDLLEGDAHLRFRERVFPVGCPSDTKADAAGRHIAALVAAGTSLTAEEILGDLARNPPVYDTMTTATPYASEAGDSSYRQEMRANRDTYLGAESPPTAPLAGCWNHEASQHNERVSERMRRLREAASASPAAQEQRCSSRWLRKQFIDEAPDLRTKKSAQRVLLPDCWPSLTVTSLPDDIVHFREDRIPTVREVARLQTFPDWFEFKGVRTTGFERRRAGEFIPQYTQVANAVPPRMAHAVAARIQSFLANLERDPTCSWSDGEPQDGHYDSDWNPPTSTARIILDKLNLEFQSLGTKAAKRRAHVSASPDQASKEEVP